MDRNWMKAYIEEEKSKQFMWSVIVACLALLLLVVILTKAIDHAPEFSKHDITQANQDIEGYYDMYAKALTERSRQRTIGKIQLHFKGFDAMLITDEKYRNFLINTRGSQ